MTKHALFLMLLLSGISLVGIPASSEAGYTGDGAKVKSAAKLQLVQTSKDELLEDDDDDDDDDELLGKDEDDDDEEEKEEVAKAEAGDTGAEAAHEALFAENRYPSAGTCGTCHPKHYG